MFVVKISWRKMTGDEIRLSYKWIACYGLPWAWWGLYTKYNINITTMCLLFIIVSHLCDYWARLSDYWLWHKEKIALQKYCKNCSKILLLTVIWKILRGKWNIALCWGATTGIAHKTYIISYIDKILKMARHRCLVVNIKWVDLLANLELFTMSAIGSIRECVHWIWFVYLGWGSIQA